jgi:hypothetical protein
LKNSSWLITSFALAGAATQALVRIQGTACEMAQKLTYSATKYGKLSDIYGRRTLVIIAYVIFVVGW